MSVVDKQGRDADEFREVPGGREPVMTAAHKWAMIRDLYSAGWSCRLIAQAFGMSSEETQDALGSNGRSMGVSW